MSEEEDDSVRRWREWSQTEIPQPVVVGRPVFADSEGSSSLSARTMGIFGILLFGGLAVVITVASWQTGSGNHVLGELLERGATQTRLPGSVSSAAPSNLVKPQGDLRNGQGTVISGIQWTPGHEPGMMVDGIGATTWQMTGNGVERKIRFDLGDVHRITSLSLADGGSADRRLSRVTWSFVDTSTSVNQVLDPTKSGLQKVDVDSVRTSVVVLRLDSVGPAPSPEADFTALSEVQILGY